MSSHSIANPCQPPQADKAVKARVDSFTSHAATFKTELERCKKAITDLHSSSAVSQAELTNQLTSAMLPLQLLLGLTAPPAASGSVSSAHQQDCNKRARTEEPAQPAVPVSPSHPVVMVTSNQLADVLQQMARSSTPAIYDFQNRAMHSNGRRDVNLSTDGVTWRNGKIILPPPKQPRGAGGSSLIVSGRDVVLESISVIGGQIGVKVIHDGSLRMTACEICDANFALRVEDEATLFASNLLIIDSASCAILLTDSATADFTSCAITGSEGDGVYLRDRSTLYGSRMHIRGCENHMICMGDTSLMRLTDSTARCHPGRPGEVNDTASLVFLGSAVDRDFDVADTASLNIS